MKPYLSVAIMVLAAGPASALDVGIGGKRGGISVSVGRNGVSLGGKAGRTGVDAGVGLERGKGASVGLSSRAGRAVGVDAGISLGGGKGIGVDVDGNLGKAEGGLSANVGGGKGVGVSGNLGSVNGSLQLGGENSPEGGGTGGTGGGGAGGTGGSKPSGNGGSGAGMAGGGKGTQVVELPDGLKPHAPSPASIVLPRGLAPTGSEGNVKFGYPLLRKIKRKSGTSDAVVRVCRQAIAAAASKVGALKVEAASAGPMRGRTAPLNVSVNYGNEVRQMTVGCRLNAAGKVVEITG